MNQSLQKLREAKLMLAEIEEVGVDVLKNLHDQRETVISASSLNRETDGLIGASGRVIRNMNTMEMAPRIVACLATIIVPVVAISTAILMRR